VFQAKGHSFSVLELLGGDAAVAAPFMGGDFATIYLSPKDYHRVHMPLAGTLREMVYVPGRIFSVNQTTAENVPELFARNERVVCLFDTERGPMAVVLVGAMIVASIETVWAGLVTPPKRELKTFRYDEAARAPIHLEKGAELGRFKLGSTAIVLFGPDQVKWAENWRRVRRCKWAKASAHLKPDACPMWEGLPPFLRIVSVRAGRRGRESPAGTAHHPAPGSKSPAWPTA
jgi:phosphatidylserine decarboxylase